MTKQEYINKKLEEFGNLKIENYDSSKFITTLIEETIKVTWDSVKLEETENLGFTPEYLSSEKIITIRQVVNKQRQLFIKFNK